jgi:hypothetical protein
MALVMLDANWIAPLQMPQRANRETTIGRLNMASRTLGITTHDEA